MFFDRDRDVRATSFTARLTVLSSGEPVWLGCSYPQSSTFKKVQGRLDGSRRKTGHAQDLPMCSFGPYLTPKQPV